MWLRVSHIHKNKNKNSASRQTVRFSKRSQARTRIEMYCRSVRQPFSYEPIYFYETGPCCNPDRHRYCTTLVQRCHTHGPRTHAHTHRRSLYVPGNFAHVLRMDIRRTALWQPDKHATRTVPAGGGGMSTVTSATEYTTFPLASFLVKCSFTATAVGCNALRTTTATSSSLDHTAWYATREADTRLPATLQASGNVLLPILERSGTKSPTLFPSLLLLRHSMNGFVVTNVSRPFPSKRYFCGATTTFASTEITLP